MASVEDLPEDLRAVARRFPDDSMAAMDQMEATMRASYVHELQSRAASEEPDRAKRTIRLAEKVISSVSAEAYSIEYNRLNREIAAANLRGDSRAAYESYAELRQLERDNPRIPDSRVAAHVTAAVSRVLDELKIPPAPKSKVFTRGFRGK